MISNRLRLALLVALLSPSAALAQPVDLPIPPATTTEYPPGISVGKTASGPVYVDAKGRTLYGMDMRTLIRWGADPSKYCKDACAETWEPLLAPSGAVPNIRYPQGFGSTTPPGFVQPQKAPDWTIIEGPQGPQWVYKGWHVVYTRKGDKRGSTEFEGADHLTWNTLKFVPPVPKIEAPMNVSTIFVDGAYALADKDGRVLFTGQCQRNCAGWQPMAGGMASQGTGQWAVNSSGDRPQWTYRGKPVFVSQEDDPTKAPQAGIVLRP